MRQALEMADYNAELFKQDELKSNRDLDAVSRRSDTANEQSKPVSRS